MNQELIGTTIDGKYQVRGLLGQGGLGSVYKAEQPQLNRQVAIKVMHLSTIVDDENRKRFEREARVLATLSHENVVEAYSLGLLPDGNPYLAMELLEGRTLSELIASSDRLDWQRTVDISIQVCRALEAAHKLGIVHRDLKPQNIMLCTNGDQEIVKVLDFGLSRLLPESASQTNQKLTQTGTLIGSVHYMSPETCAGKAATERSDIYALGCIMYQCLTGVPPFDCENPVGMLYKHLNELPPAFDGRQVIPEQLEMLVFKTLEKNPENRFASMTEIAEALTLIKEGKAHQLNLSVSVREKRKSAWLVLIAVPVALAAIGISLDQKSPTSQKQALPQLLENSATRSRSTQIDRAKRLAAAAADLKSKGAFAEARVTVLRSLAQIGHAYLPDAINKQFAEKDLEVVKMLANVCNGLPIGERTSVDGFLDRADSNDCHSLNMRQKVEMMIADAQICSAFKNYTSAGVRYYSAIQLLLDKGQVEEAGQVLNQFEKAFPRNEEGAHLYLLESRAIVYSYLGPASRALAYLKEARDTLERRFPAGSSKRRMEGLRALLSTEQRVARMCAEEKIPFDDPSHKTFNEMMLMVDQLKHGKFIPMLNDKKPNNKYRLQECHEEAIRELNWLRDQVSGDRLAILEKRLANERREYEEKYGKPY